MKERRPHRGGGYAPFLAGVLVGVLLSGVVAAGGTAAVLLAHPRLASRLHSELFPAGSQIVPLGDLSAVTVVVSTSSAGSRISRFIYGVAAADQATLVALGATVDRWGGNSASR